MNIDKNRQFFRLFFVIIVHIYQQTFNTDLFRVLGVKTCLCTTDLEIEDYLVVNISITDSVSFLHFSNHGFLCLFCKLEVFSSVSCITPPGVCCRRPTSTDDNLRNRLNVHLYSSSLFWFLLKKFFYN